MSTYTNTTFLTEAQVTQRYPSLEMMIPTNVSATRSAKIEEFIATTKDVHVRTVLLDEIPKRFPTTANDLITRYLGARKRRLEATNFADHVSGGGSLVYSQGTWYDSLSRYTLRSNTAEDPAWFFNDGVPNASTYANSANNGSWLINTASHAAATRLYINRGTLAVPSWIAWSNEALLDLITQPDELLDASLKWFAFCCYEAMANMTNGADETRLGYYVDQRDYYKTEALVATVKAIPRLGIDSSSDGSLSDDELATTQEEPGYFA